MYQGKHMKKTKKPVALLASLALVFAVAVAGTLAFLTTHTAEVKNTFTPSKVPNKVVEEFDGNVKSDVKIKNEGDVPAYIRVALVATWVNDKGEVLGEQADYSVTYPESSKWKQHTDGYYYYTEKVDANTTTGVLFEEIKLKDGVTPPAGYSLSIEILSQSIQADGVDSATNKTPVMLAWGVQPEDLK